MAICAWLRSAERRSFSQGSRRAPSEGGLLSGPSQSSRQPRRIRRAGQRNARDYDLGNAQVRICRRGVFDGAGQMSHSNPLACTSRVVEAGSCNGEYTLRYDTRQSSKSKPTGSLEMQWRTTGGQQCQGNQSDDRNSSNANHSLGFLERGDGMPRASISLLYRLHQAKTYANAECSVSWFKSDKLKELERALSVQRLLRRRIEELETWQQINVCRTILWLVALVILMGLISMVSFHVAPRACIKFESVACIAAVSVNDTHMDSTVGSTLHVYNRSILQCAARSCGVNSDWAVDYGVESIDGDFAPFTWIPLLAVAVLLLRCTACPCCSCSRCSAASRMLYR